MTKPQVLTFGGTALDEAAIQALRDSLRAQDIRPGEHLPGHVIRPGDLDYDAARQVFNAMIDKHPALIVRCTGVADVIAAVNFARVHDLLVAVRGGGHNVTGNAVCDGGIVIDLSRMKGVRVDPATRTVRAEAGITWGEVTHETQAFGLAATGGYYSTTGIAGLTLGGGLGWLVRKHGLALDNLLSVDLVLADGRFLKASSTENEDLFWGVRGGGGNFGIVTSFEFRAHPVGTVLAGVVMHPLARARDVWRFFRDRVAAQAPDELEAAVALVPSPDGGPVAGIILVYAGDFDAGEQVVRPIKEFGPPLVDAVQPMPYSAAQHMLDAVYLPGYHNYWKSNYLKDLSDEAIDTIVRYFETAPSKRTMVHVEHLGGAMSRVAATETAFAHRGWPYNFLITSMWADPADSEQNIRWAREFWEAMQKFAVDAVYVNYLGVEGEERVRAAYGANFERLVGLKNKYDATNFFRLNQNIPPTM